MKSKITKQIKKYRATRSLFRREKDLNRPALLYIRGGIIESAKN
jgi:hypothetical protein